MIPSAPRIPPLFLSMLLSALASISAVLLAVVTAQGSGSGDANFNPQRMLLFIFYLVVADL
jgi:hypothetical protein